ncbi:MAG: DNA methylase [Treponema sp.]|nr:DNA methylase [Treponema sp.]
MFFTGFLGMFILTFDLAKAHQKLEKAVEAAYGRSFEDDSQRVAFLFELYQRILSGTLFR